MGWWPAALRSSRSSPGGALRRLALLAIAILIAGCGPATQVANPVNTRGQPLPTASTCQPTDQDQYVYRPDRLQFVAPCIRITGTVVSSSSEADGDVHINVKLDPQFAGLLTNANVSEDGYLIVEPVCQFPPLQAEAIHTCATDTDPLSGPLPKVGDHVFMEGRYVLDLQHGGWSELHPLYRWGTAP